MIVTDIIDEKGRAVAKAQPGDMLVEAARTMQKFNVGALVVCDKSEQLVGIVSERDIMHAVADHGRPAAEIQVKKVMTTELHTCTLADAIIDVMHLMTEKRIRHVPVMDGKQLIAIISIGDVVKRRLSETKIESQVMRDYVQVLRSR